jgi:hypothetical protein
MQKAIYFFAAMAMLSIAVCALEFPNISMMWKVEQLLIAALLIWLVFLAACVFCTQNRFGAIKPYLTELSLTAVALIPLTFALTLNLNKIGDNRAEVPFTFAAERAFYSAPFGMLKTDKAKPTKFKLILLDEDGETRYFTYKNGPLYPNTQPGETVALPMRSGFFGTWVMVE